MVARAKHACSAVPECRPESADSDNASERLAESHEQGFIIVTAPPRF
jgi:hypothetical protein